VFVIVVPNETILVDSQFHTRE